MNKNCEKITDAQKKQLRELLDRKKKGENITNSDITSQVGISSNQLHTFRVNEY